MISTRNRARSTFRYRAYGKLAQSSGAGPTLLAYAGQLRDPSGLYHLRARWYDPATGRFITRDPVRGDLSVPSTLNAYLYSGANPARFSDPSGRFCIPCLLAAAWVGTQIGLTGFDAITTAETLSDPEAGEFEKVVTIGLFWQGLADPVGGGLTTLRPVIRTWEKGTFRSVAASMRYQFAKHGAEVGARDVVEYTRMGQDFFDSFRHLARPHRLKSGTGLKIQTDELFGIYTQDGKLISFGKR